VANLVCACEERFRSICEDELPADNEHEGEQYCVLHFPSVAKDLTKFAEAIEKATPKDKSFGEGKYWVCPVSTDSLPLGHSTSSQSNLFVL